MSWEKIVGKRKSFGREEKSGHILAQRLQTRDRQRKREKERKKEREKRERERDCRSQHLWRLVSRSFPPPHSNYTHARPKIMGRERERERERYAKTGSFNWPLQVVSPLCSYVCARE